MEAVEKDKRIVMNELMGRAKVFDEVAGRRYRHCCELKKSLFHKLNHKAFEEWIKDTVCSWQ